MNSLRTTDNRLYFEKALQEGIKRKRITQDTIAQIIASGPHGILQISEAFGNPFKQSGLQEGQQQFVALISFYLLYTFGDDLNAGIQEINTKDILELSRGGSSLIKNMAKYPEFTTVDEGEDSKYKEYEAFFKKFERYQSKEAYNTEIERRKNNIRLRSFCEILHEESGFEWDKILPAEETITTDLFPKVITRKFIQAEWEIALHNGKFQHKRWDDLLGKIPKGYEQFKKDFSFANCFKRYNQFFLGISAEMNEMESEKKINIHAWNALFGGKKYGRPRIACGILSGYFFNTPKEKLTSEDIQSIILQARKNYITIDEIITAFHNSTPVRDSSIQGTIALEEIESAWGKYVLDKAVTLDIASNRLKKALKIREEKLK